MITITVNGEPHQVESETRLDAFVATLADDPRGIAIERNREIVPKSQHGAVTLEDGDVLEIVQFVGGG